MNMRFATMLLCAATTSACAENLPPVVDTSSYPLPSVKPPTAAPSITTLNQMMNRMEQMQKEIQQLTGKVEDQVFLIAELKKQQKTMYSDFDERLQALENKGAVTPEASAVAPDASAATPGDTATDATPTDPALATDAAAGAAAITESAPETKVPDEAAPPAEQPATATEPKTKSPEAPIQASDEEKQVYEQAYKQLSTGHAPEAIAAFDDYLIKYPSGGYASNSQYWLGEAYRVKQDNDAAKAAFNKVVDNYPNSPKVPDALLKLGYIEIELNNADKAREYLTRIRTDFPNSNAAYLASKKLATLTDVKP